MTYMTSHFGRANMENERYNSLETRQLLRNLRSDPTAALNLDLKVYYFTSTYTMVVRRNEVFHNHPSMLERRRQNKFLKYSFSPDPGRRKRH